MICGWKDGYCINWRNVFVVSSYLRGFDEVEG